MARGGCVCDVPPALPLSPSSPTPSSDPPRTPDLHRDAPFLPETSSFFIYKERGGPLWELARGARVLKDHAFHRDRLISGSPAMPRACAGGEGPASRGVMGNRLLSGKGEGGQRGRCRLMPAASRTQEVRAGGVGVILRPPCASCFVGGGVPRGQVAHCLPSDTSASLPPQSVLPRAPAPTQFLPASYLRGSSGGP